MSLQNFDIRKTQRISLKGVKLPVVRIRESQPEIDINQLKDLARKILKEKNNYTKAEIISKLQNETKTSLEKAEIAFNLILQAEAIECFCFDRYYLTESTPF